MITYFVQMGDSVKIGTTNNPKHRLMQLKVSFPYDLTLLGLADIPEKEAHKIAETFAKRRNGEWFEFNNELTAWIKSLPPTNTEWAGFRFNPIPKSRESTIRKNITIDPLVAKLGKKIANDNGMSFSGWVAELIHKANAEEVSR